ncbi:BtrH N-terminal domain-containing protein [bacterium]|nr:BtrH N-terminal domain-containing protein [bacterium]
MEFKHKMAAHCETGTLAGILGHNGLQLSEPMIFGIAHGIFFGYFESKNFPFPTFIVRTRPGEVRDKLSKTLGIKLKRYKFKDADKGMKTLDGLLDQGHAVGAQVDFFYMEYLPEWIRVHNNVHFVNIVGRDGNDYVISDSYHQRIANLSPDLLIKARWAGGHMAPKGFLYHPTKLNAEVDLKKPIIKGIKKACWNMLKIPIPFVGVKGIYKFADKINGWSDLTRDVDHLSHEIMKINVLLEDQGTGGAGFRYMYATFLKQASEIVNNPTLNEMSERIMKIGDDWRNISYFAAKIGKKRDLGPDRISELSQLIRLQGDAEKAFFTDLKKVY